MIEHDHGIRTTKGWPSQNTVVALAFILLEYRISTHVDVTPLEVDLSRNRSKVQSFLVSKKREVDFIDVRQLVAFWINSYKVGIAFDPEDAIRNGGTVWHPACHSGSFPT